MNEIKTIFFILCISIMSTACSVTPWVKPYEKSYLADEIMSLDRDPIASSYLGHVYDAREGARGAGIAAGGGCGCN